VSRAQSRVGPPWWAVLSAATALVALVVGWVVAGAVQPAGYDPVRETISALARHGAMHRWIMTTGLYAVGICHLVTAAGMRGGRPAARIVLAVGGAGGVGLATFAEPPSGTTTGHIACTSVAFIALGVFPVLVGDRRRHRFPLRQWDVVGAGLLSAALLGWLFYALQTGDALGVAERVLTAQQTVWPLLVVLALRRSPRDAEVAARDAREGVGPVAGR
jgi:hypothetical membrane protein